MGEGFVRRVASLKYCLSYHPAHEASDKLNDCHLGTTAYCCYLGKNLSVTSQSPHRDDIGLHRVRINIT